MENMEKTGSKEEKAEMVEYEIRLHKSGGNIEQQMKNMNVEFPYKAGEGKGFDNEIDMVKQIKNISPDADFENAEKLNTPVPEAVVPNSEFEDSEGFRNLHSESAEIAHIVKNTEKAKNILVVNEEEGGESIPEQQIKDAEEKLKELYGNRATEEANRLNEIGWKSRVHNKKRPEGMEVE